MSTTTTIGDFRSVIEGATYAPSFQSLSRDFPDDSGTVTNVQRDAVSDAYSAAVDAVLAEHGITRCGDELIGDYGTDYDLEAVREEMAERVDFWTIAEAAAEGVDAGSYRR